MITQATKLLVVGSFRWKIIPSKLILFAKLYKKCSGIILCKVLFITLGFTWVQIS